MPVTTPGEGNQCHDKCYVDCYGNPLQGHLNQTWSVCGVKKSFLEEVNSTLESERGVVLKKSITLCRN